MAITQNGVIYHKDITAALDGKIDKASSLTLEEIQESTDLTGKVVSAGTIRDTVFTVKELPFARYIQFGKLVVVRFNAAISDDVYTGLPRPVDYFTVITFRDNTNGKFASFYMDGEAVIKTYLATNYTPGDVYSGTFTYIAG